MEKEAPEKVYRYEEVVYGYGDEWGNSSWACVRVELRTYNITKRTPKGYWISYSWGGKFKFVLANAKKKFAHQTLEAAAESFIRRKERQIGILKGQLERAETALWVFNYQQKKKES